MRIKAAESLVYLCSISTMRAKVAFPEVRKELVDSRRAVWLEYDGLRSGRVLRY